MQLVMAAMATEPVASDGLLVSDPDRDRGVPSAAGRRVVGPEAVAQVAQRDAVLRAPRAGQRGTDRSKVQLQGLVEERRGAGQPPEALLPGVGLHERHVGLVPPGQAQVGDGFLVDGEDARRGAVLRRHVREGGTVGQRQRGQAISGELHVGANDAVRAQHLADHEDQVGGRAAGRQRSVQAHAHDPWQGLVERLAQEHGLRLDAAHPVAQDAQAADHGGVGIGAHEGVREGHEVAIGHLASGLVRAQADHLAEVLEVDLVDDAGPGRHHAEAPQRCLRPAQQLVALAVALVLALHVEGVGPRAAEAIDLDAVVDDQAGRHERVDAGGVSAQLRHGVAHGRQVHHGGHAGEVLEQHAPGHEGDPPRPRRRRVASPPGPPRPPRWPRPWRCDAGRSPAAP